MVLHIQSKKAQALLDPKNKPLLIEAISRAAAGLHPLRQPQMVYLYTKNVRGEDACLCYFPLRQVEWTPPVKTKSEGLLGALRRWVARF